MARKKEDKMGVTFQNTVMDTKMTFPGVSHTQPCLCLHKKRLTVSQFRVAVGSWEMVSS